MSTPITEEMHVHDAWYKEARDMTAEKLPEFVRKLSHDYDHDYGTICHAITAAAIGAAWSVERSPSGGITGFQAGAVMWEFMRHWNRIEGPARLLDYNDLLFPQMEHKFRCISPETWKDIQEKAKAKLSDTSGADTSVVAHWQSIADGNIPFGLQVEH